MPRPALSLVLDEQDRVLLEKKARSTSSAHGEVLRARIILGCAEKGFRVDALAEQLGVAQNVIIKWRNRFIAEGINGLKDRRRSGRPLVYGREVEEAIERKLAEDPPQGMDAWTGAELARELGLEKHVVWRILRKKARRGEDRSAGQNTRNENSEPMQEKPEA